MTGLAWSIRSVPDACRPSGNDFGDILDTPVTRSHSAEIRRRGVSSLRSRQERSNASPPNRPVQRLFEPELAQVHFLHQSLCLHEGRQLFHHGIPLS